MFGYQDLHIFGEKRRQCAILSEVEGSLLIFTRNNRQIVLPGGPLSVLGQEDLNLFRHVA